MRMLQRMLVVGDINLITADVAPGKPCWGCMGSSVISKTHAVTQFMARAGEALLSACQQGIEW